MTDHVDVLIVGAGISGISMAWHLSQNCPSKSFAMLEMRGDIGGTWDLFRYPGIRSDSDMHTLGFRFRPWTEAKAIADAPSIMRYLRGAVADYKLQDRIRFHHKVIRSRWSTADARWTVEVEVGPDKERREITCNFLCMCSGYYNYAKGYRPDFPGEQRFKGRLIHPQHWPEDLDYAGKRVVVIGSGATAVTIVPEMAKQAALVTMLQRSPTYMVSRPAQDALANWLRKVMPAKTAYAITRWRNVLLQQFFYKLARSRPEKVKERMLNLLKEQLPPGYDIQTHFTPSYNPWDQRVCLVPDADMFQALGSGKAEIVTDHIETFTEDGIRLRSGKELKADIVVVATGLDLQLMSDMEVVIDGKRHDVTKSLNYKAMMFSDVPNLSLTIGYSNASWTLKADLTAEYVCRLLNHMDRTGTRICCPRADGTEAEDVPFFGLNSGYVLRNLHKFPRQGSRFPWRVHQSYTHDLVALRYGKLEDGAMQFYNPPAASATEDSMRMAAE